MVAHFMKLQQFRILSLKQFKHHLLSFKTKTSSEEELYNKLTELHRAYLVYKNAMEIKTIDQIKGCNTDEILFVSVDGKIVTVENHPILDSKFSNLRCHQIQEGSHDNSGELQVERNDNTIMETNIMYFEYKNRACDLCGKYFTDLFYDVPLERRREDDFYLAYHGECSELLRN